MAGFSDAREISWLDHLFRNTAVTSPTTVYAALHTADPGETGTNEVSGGAYIRKAVTFASPSSRASSNSVEVLFDQATASWGSITHVSIWDAETSGNVLYSGALDAAVSIGIGDRFRFAAGQLSVSLSSLYSIYLAGKILDHDLRNTSYTSPTNVYLGFNSADPAGTGANELSGNGYARQTLGSGGDSEFSAAASGTTDNDSEISFPAASGGGQGTATHATVYDASSSGNSLLETSISSRTINENDQVSVAAGDMDVTFD